MHFFCALPGARELAILGIALLALSIIALTVYWVGCHQKQRISVPQPAEHAPIPFKEMIAQDKQTPIFEQDKLEKMPGEEERENQKSAEPDIKVDQPMLEVPVLDFTQIFGELENKTKNNLTYLPLNLASCRFEDILCPSHTHVNVLGSNSWNYLHANHVKLEGKHFIATQYPLQVELFWRMCQKTSLILDLTNSGDMKRGLIPYVPVQGEAKTYGNLNVALADQEEIGKVQAQLYHYTLRDKENAKHPLIIPRVHYEGWDDHCGITEDDLDELTVIMESHKQQSNQPVIVHCRAGMGRTGTLIVASVLLELINQKQVNSENLLETIFRLILEGRAQRGPAFVQNPQQLEALWKWSSRLLLKN